METLTELLKHVAGKFPDRRALSVSRKFDITHSRHNQLIEHAASLLVAAGVKPHDVVALTFPNTVEEKYYPVNEIERLEAEVDMTLHLRIISLNSGNC
ncbi:hypothetical protein L1987_01555 [Smallanthus sonchifolius]|uniref:Uncharacterized protein n=1 Tax=Smallanthus sonchifolius TaxID=185202 RepID=A0ACB9K5J3_9ASTR|nr:hypothetical protein L1987_01555 [Smallanthus sonchifolius]